MRQRGRSKLCEQTIKDGSINALDGTADGGFAWDASFGGLEESKEGILATGRPVGNGASAAMIVEHGGEDDGPDEGPFELFATRFARVGQSSKQGDDIGILWLVHGVPPLSLVAQAMVHHGPSSFYRL